MRASRRVVIVAAAAVVLLLVLVGFRHAIIRSVLQTTLSSATGYSIRFGDQKLGTRHAALFDVHVVKNGDPVLDAQRVDVEYALRDIFPGGQHRFGFASISIQKPILTITRHADGTLTFNRSGGSSAAPPAATKQAAAPYYFTARVRDGVVRLVDAAPLQPDLAYQTIENVAIDASVKSDARTTARMSGVLLGRRTQGAAVTRYPLAVHTLIDVQRGVALTNVQAHELPLRGAMGFFIHSNAVRFDDGVLQGVGVQYYALAPKAGQDFVFKLGGAMTLAHGRLAVGALARPVRDLSGPLVITDETLSSTGLRGSLASTPLRGRGAMFDLFGTPAFRIALAGDGDLQALRSLFGFSATLPVSGPAHLETVLSAGVAKPLIRTWFASPHLAYGKYPIDALDGVVDYYDNAVAIGGVRARYGSAALGVGGRVLFLDNLSDMAFVLTARGPGASIPYADVVAPDSEVTATAMLTQPPVRDAGFTARGTLVARGGTNGSGTFAVNPRGVGEFGPFAFNRADGSSLAGAFELQRPISLSAGWLHARGFRLAAVSRVSGLPGAALPALPPISGIVDGDLAGGGTPDSFGIAGVLHGRDLRVANYALGTGSVTIDGNLTDVRLAGITLDGPLGRFSGEGAYGDGLFALQGRYDGSLQQLRPFTGDATARGDVHGPVSATIASNHIVVQSSGADLANANVLGVGGMSRVAGTIAVDGTSLRIVAADATIGGSRAVATDAGGAFLVSAPDLPVRALRGVGIPLSAGTLALYGLADLRGHAPKFDGVVALTDGVASGSGYPVSGGADLTLADATAVIRRGAGALGRTYGEFAGTVGGVGRGTPAYDLNANVPIGDVAEVRTMLRLPLRTLEGSFSAALRVRGSGARPDVAGDVAVPEGSYNGLAFSAARAAVDLTPSAVRARNGVVTVGSTHAQIDAAVSVASRAFNVGVRSPAANLADFDDYFDEGETLAGTGRVALAFANDGRTTRTSGNVSVRDFRYRRYAFGSTDAVWSQRGGTVAAALNVRGTHGALRSNGTVVPAAGDALHAFERGTYRANVQAQHVDLGTWLPAFGITAPVLGAVDATGSVAGRWPRLGVNANATLSNGSVFGYAVKTGSVVARSDGARIVISQGVADLGFARFDATGSFGFDTREPLALAVHGQTPDVHAALAMLLPKGPRFDVGGALQADARIGGTLLKPRVTAGFDLTNARYMSLAVPRILGSASYDGTTLTVNDAEATFAKGKVLVAGALPLALQPFGVRPNAPLSFTLGLTAVDLAPFAPFLPGRNTKLGGTLDGRVAIEGTAAAPLVIGDIALADGSYVSDLDRAAVSKANARLAFHGTSVALEALHANVGGGTLDGSGNLDLPFPGVHSNAYAVALTAHGARIDSPQYGRGTIDGAMRLQSGAQVPVLSGDVTLTNASIPFAAIYRSAGGGGAPGAGAAPFDIAFALTARAGKNVRVQSSIIDVGATGSLDLTGRLSSPKLGGTLTATPGGYFSTYNRAFRVQQATVRFDPTQGVVPFVDLRAYAHVTNPDPDPTRNAVGSADITVLVSGPADEIASGATPLTFDSNPPYSQEQIVGLLLDASVFGAINFGQQQNGTTLRGAPGESNPLLPPGVTPYQAGIINFNQEAFSVLNGQITQRFLAPIERVLTGRFGLTDFEVTVDYGGGVGYNALKQLGHRDVYFSFGQTLSAPARTTLGFTSRPDATTSIQFSYFQQNGNPAITNNANGTTTFTNTQRLRGIQAVSNRQGFTFLVVRKYP